MENKDVNKDGKLCWKIKLENKDGIKRCKIKM